MKKQLLLLIIFGSIAWGGILYFLINLTSYSNLTKGFLCIAITLVLLFILKIVDPISNEKEDREEIGVE
jgi:hypothetical protein